MLWFWLGVGYLDRSGFACSGALAMIGSVAGVIVETS
jgi:hypothetical protein